MTGVSVTTGNGFAGSVLNSTSTPAITISTNVNGIIKGNGTSISAATVGTDYIAPPSGTSLLKANSGGALANAVAGTDYQSPIGTISGIAKGNGANSLTAASAGTDYVSPSVSTNFTKPQRPSLSSEVTPSTNTITWDLITNQVLPVNLNAAISTFNLTGTLSSLYGYQYQLVVRYNGGASITWPASIKWPGGTTPTLTGTSGKVDIFSFVVASNDGGTTFYLMNTGISQNI